MDLSKPAIALAALLGLSGCVARTVLSVATAPVKIVGKAADLATTSQSEADERRGRHMREREEELGRLERKRRKFEAKCLEGDKDACADRDTVAADIERLQQAPID